MYKLTQGEIKGQPYFNFLRLTFGHSHPHSHFYQVAFVTYTKLGLGMKSFFFFLMFYLVFERGQAGGGAERKRDGGSEAGSALTAACGA